jgi:hypothetical protein
MSRRQQRVLLFVALTLGAYLSGAGVRIARADVLQELVEDVIDDYQANRLDEEGEEKVESGTLRLFQARVAAQIAEKGGLEDKAVTTEKLLQTYRIEIDRTDQQIGAGASASGSTSAVEKAGLAWLLGLAVENGAITQKEDETGITLSTTPYALLTLGGRDTLDRYDSDWFSPMDVARRVGVSATVPLDNSGSSQDRNFDPDGVSEISAKYVFWGDRSPRSAWFRGKWEDKVAPQVRNRLAGQSALAKAVYDVPANRQVVASTAKAIWGRIRAALAKKPNVAGLNKTLSAIVNEEIEAGLKAMPPLDQARQNQIFDAARRFAEANGSIENEQKELAEMLDELSGTPEVSAAYTFHRKDEDADYSELKLLADFDTGYVSVIANAGISFNHGSGPDKTVLTSSGEPLPDRNDVRSYQVSVGLERKIPNFLPFRIEDSGKNEISLSLNGRFEHLDDASDDLGVVQGKINIPLVPGVDLPISVTYATRSEEIDEDEVRGNFGISVNTDKLYALAGLQAYRAAR